jgi:hypothetical protein
MSTTLSACQKEDFTNVESNNEVMTNMKSLHKKAVKPLIVSEVMKYIYEEWQQTGMI